MRKEYEDHSTDPGGTEDGSRNSPPGQFETTDLPIQWTCSSGRIQRERSTSPDGDHELVTLTDPVVR